MYIYIFIYFYLFIYYIIFLIYFVVHNFKNTAFNHPPIFYIRIRQG